MSVTVTPIYAALTALLYFALCWHVIMFRMSHRVSMGDAGDPTLLRRMRAQANCAEYAPFGLLLLLILELQIGASIWVHALGLAVIVGRLAHAYAFVKTPMNFKMRQLGMILTFTQLTATSLAILIIALW